ncbi:MAG: hypothetical protein ACHQ2Y_10430, partial [Candidatus Lutacidiplasmatales archaeon]
MPSLFQRLRRSKTKEPEEESPPPEEGEATGEAAPEAIDDSSTVESPAFQIPEPVMDDAQIGPRSLPPEPPRPEPPIEEAPEPA